MEHLESSEVILGVDTHLDVHVGVVIDAAGRAMGTLSVGTNQDGYQQLLCWAQNFGMLRRAGVEGTGSYGAALTQFLQGNGVTVIEINRPDRSRRRGRGKSDATDAQSAARAVLAGDATSIPKSHNGLAEGLRTLNLVRRSAVKAKTQTINQIRTLLVSAPQAIQDAPYKLDASEYVAACAGLSQGGTSAALASLQTALRLLAKRWTVLNDELRELDATLARLTKKAAPRLLSRFGVGPQTAATLLITAGDNPTPLHSEAALAALCGTSPLQASSGKVHRHRLNRGGDRQANNALWTNAMV
jgi:transposase